MKPEIQRIEEMRQALCDKNQCVAGKDNKSCAQCEEIVKTLIQLGYGNVSEYQHEIEELNKKLNKQIRLTRDSNAGKWGAEKNMYHYQCKAGKLEIKNDELETTNKSQLKEIMKLKKENAQYKAYVETLVSQFYRDKSKEARKQAQVDLVAHIKYYIDCLVQDEFGDSADSAKYLTIEIEKFEHFLDDYITRTWGE